MLLKIKNIVLSIFACMIFTGQLNAQQTTVNNQYLTNPYMLSPAFAGYNFKSQVFIGYRKQWTKMPGSPQTSFANIVLPIWEKVWVGASIISDKTSIYKSFYGSLSYTYQLQFAPKHFFRFSIWGSFFQNTINLNDIIVVDKDDPLLQDHTKLVGTAFNAGSGLLYQNENLILGLSVPSLFVNNEKYAVDGNKNLIVIERQLLAFGYYKFYLVNNWQMKFGGLFRTTKNSPVSYDIFAIGTYKNTVWGGLLYRKGTIIGISAGGYLLKDITLNYTYEFLNNGFTSYTSGTHEITIGYNINLGKSDHRMEYEHYPMIMKYNRKYRK